jgi:hypothetical protein
MRCETNASTTSSSASVSTRQRARLVAACASVIVDADQLPEEVPRGCPPGVVEGGVDLLRGALDRTSDSSRGEVLGDPEPPAPAPGPGGKQCVGEQRCSPAA